MKAQSIREVLPLLLLSSSSAFVVPKGHGFLLLSPSSGASRLVGRRESLCSEPPSDDNTSWSIADDWNALSQQENRPSEVFRQDLVALAAYRLQLQQQQQQEGTADDDNKNDVEEWMQQMIQEIHNEQEETVFDNEQEDDESSSSASFFDEDVMSREIAQLVRCNEDPTQLLIAQGRAMPELSNDERHDPRQLVQLVVVSGSDDNDDNTLVCQPTPFLQQAVQAMFDQHATPPKQGGSDDDDDNAKRIMNKQSIAHWLRQCLGIPRSLCGPHDPRVTHITSQFGKYKQGYLERDDFEALYLQAIVGTKAQLKSLLKQATTTTTTSSSTSTTDTFFNLLTQQRSYEIEQVWRDLELHQIESPAQAQWNTQAAAMERQIAAARASLQSVASSSSSSELFHDECEIVYDQNEDVSNAWTQNVQTGAWTHTGKSSHERIELCRNDQGEIVQPPTPVRFQDGQFVYIDEESCIGCQQCALAAPTSFVMLQDASGRARTYNQDTSPAVATAVATCPVNCMHYVGYERLVELEVARDRGILPKKPNGDDRRDHHRHFGPQPQATRTSTSKSSSKTSSNNEPASQWIAHTPLYVSRMESSDANHKESIYHYLRNQCYKSAACPQKGCYDCPMYASNPRANPHWKKRVQAATSRRAQHFQTHQPDLVNSFRKKTAEL